jgi:hypothetical protein
MVLLLLVGVVGTVLAINAENAKADDDAATVRVSPALLTFNAVVNGAAPASQTVSVTAYRRTAFTASASVQSGSTRWLSISPSGSLWTNQTLRVSVNPSGLAAGTYQGTISITANRATQHVAVTFAVNNASNLSVSPTQLTFSATAGGTAPAAQNVSVTAGTTTAFTASAFVSSGSITWLAVSPSGNLTTNRTLSVSANPTGLAAGTYAGTVTITSGDAADRVAVSFVISASSGGGGSTGGYKLVGWNDLGMHCQDGKDFSVFAVLPPYNTIHAHLMDGSGNLVTTSNEYTVTYQAVNDPLTNTLNTTSSAKTNFWQFASALGFGNLAADVGLKGFKMPGSGNVPQAMTFSTTDNTWVATGIPMMPYADAAAAPYPVNYFPMMRLMATDSLGNMLATTDIVLPVSDEMTCSACHASGTGSVTAMPAGGWSNLSDPLKDVKHNILKKHDDRYQNTNQFQSAATAVGYSTAGLETTTSTKPVLCAACHADNALGLAGVSGVEPLTTAAHNLHANVVDPATGQAMDNGTTRSTCYNCHPGPKTQCLRGVMGNLKTSSGAKVIECQGCHGSMSTLAVATRQGWLDEPNCQACHTGTATSNSGQIAYTSVFVSTNIMRVAADQTFATNANTPQTGVSLYRYSSGHGGLQCEACHGSTHAEYASSVVNDNVQSTNLQGHTGVLAECAACHATVPSTTTGGPHGMHPIGTGWVSTHQGVADAGGASQCQVCHGTDYRGTILSKTLAEGTLAGRLFPAGTIIGCYSCHNGPGGG